MEISQRSPVYCIDLRSYVWQSRDSAEEQWTSKQTSLICESYFFCLFLCADIRARSLCELMTHAPPYTSFHPVLMEGGRERKGGGKEWEKVREGGERQRVREERK